MRSALSGPGGEVACRGTHFVAWANGGLWLLMAGFIALLAYGAAGIGVRTPIWMLVWFLAALGLAALWGLERLRPRVALLSIAVAGGSIWMMGSIAASSTSDSDFMAGTIAGTLFGLALVALIDSVLALLSATGAIA